MPKGNIVEYLTNLNVEGCMYHYTIPSTTVIGGHGNPKSDNYSFYIDHALDPSLLALIVSSKEFSGNMTWKISLNEITLTREFKPQTVVDVDDKVYAVQVFDISNITRSPGMYKLRMVCETAEPVSIDSVLILGALRRGSVSAALNIGIGVLAIKPGEVTLLKLRPCKHARNSVLIIYDSPSRRARIKLGISEKELHISNKVGMYELMLENVNVDEIRIEHEKPQIPYYPRYFKIYGVLTYSTPVRGPHVEVRDAVINEDGKLVMTLTNTGDIDATNIVLVGMHMGGVVFRDKIEKIKAQSIIERTYTLGTKHENILVRLIYQGLNGQRVKSFKVRKGGRNV